MPAACTADGPARPITSSPEVDGCRPSTSLSGSTAQQRPSSSRCAGQRQLHQNESTAGLSLKRTDRRHQLVPASTSASRCSVSRGDADLGAVFVLLLRRSGARRHRRRRGSCRVRPRALGAQARHAVRQLGLDAAREELRRREWYAVIVAPQCRKWRSPVSTIAIPARRRRRRLRRRGASRPAARPTPTPASDDGIEAVAKGKNASLAAAPPTARPSAFRRRGRPRPPGSAGRHRPRQPGRPSRARSRSTWCGPHTRHASSRSAPLLRRRGPLGRRPARRPAAHEVVRLLNEQTDADLRSDRGAPPGADAAQEPHVLSRRDQDVARAVGQPRPITTSACGPPAIASPRTRRRARPPR